MKAKHGKRSRFAALLMVFMMIFTMIPSTAFATGESDETVIYTGSDWPYSRYYVAQLTLSGAEVSYIDGTDVYLAHTTASDAALTFTATAGGSNSGYLGINWNDESTNTKTYTTNLVNGEAAVKVYAYKASGAGVSRSGTKTFNIHIAEPNELPVLAEGYSAEVEAAVTAGETYTLDLSKVFTDADGDALTYTVSVDGSTATAADSAYSYLNTVPGTYTLKFTATDGKTLAAKQPTYTVTLTVKNSEATYDVGVTVPEGINPTFYAVNTVNSGTVVKGDQLVYENGNVKVPENISRIMWEVENMVGFSAPVSAGAAIELVKVTFDAKFDSGEADTTATVKITDAEGVKIIGNGTDTYILPSISGFTYNVATSNSAYNDVTLEDQTPKSGSLEVIFGQKHFTVIAPKDSVVSAGTLTGSFKYTFASAISTETVGETVVYKFAPLSGNAFVRVQRPDDKDAVTYWDWTSSKADGQTITITEEMLFMNDSGDDIFNDDTVYRNFEKFAMDLGDVYMNINNQGYINLNVGDEKGLNMFRNWQAIEAFTNAKISLPDFSYEIINIEGSDVISIEPDANNSAAATLKAKSEGTAIVLVTYDAMYSDVGAVNSMGYATGGGTPYTAIWPDRTGVFVVSVGKDGTAINSNMTCNGAVFDAEHSPQFYVGDEGATVTFKPDEGVTVTVNRSTVGTETLSFGTFTNEGVTVAEDGTVTVSGLKTGRHIIKLEKDGVASYQVVTATQATVQYVSADGRDLGSNPIVPPGGTFYAKIKGLTNPAEKFATKYNFNVQLTYTDQNGNSYKNSSGAAYGQYNFSSTEQIVEVTVPEDWTEEKITLNGFFQMGGFSGGAIGDHRLVSYGVASDMAHGSSAGMKLGTLPELSVEVKEIPATSLTLDKTELKVEVDESETILATVEPANTTDAVQWSSSDESIATVENGVVTGVKAGTAVITAKIRDLTATCTLETYGEPKEIYITTGSGRATSSKPTLSEIMLKGIKGTLQDGYTETEYTVIVDDSTSKTKAIKIRMTHNFRSSYSARSFYYWVNTPKQTHMSSKNASEENPCTMTVTPDWEGDNAVITVGLGKDSGIGNKQYVITLHKHGYDEEIVDEKYLVSEADYDSKAVYYKSCECGVAGTETFEYGETLESEVKTAAKKDIAEYKNADDYRDAQKTELAAVIEAANNAIDAAETEEAVAKAVEDAKAAMDAIKTDAQLDQEEAEAVEALAKAKEEAKKEVAEYKDADDYRDAQKTELAAAIEAANHAIDAAETEEAVAKAVEDAKAAMDAIKTDAQLDQEEAEAAEALAKAKEEAKKAVAEYKDADDYRDAQKTELAVAIEAANNAIDAAETEEVVAKAVEDAKAAMDAIKTDAQLDQEESIIDDEGQNPEEPAEPETPVAPEEPADDDDVIAPGETEGEDEGTEDPEQSTDSDELTDEDEGEAIDDQDAEDEDTESADTGDKNQPFVYLTAMLAAVLALAGIRRREN